MRFCLMLSMTLLFTVANGQAQSAFEQDTIKTSDGDLMITFIKHATLLMQYHGLNIHIDPVSQFADYSTMPKADIILITHHHGDHFDKKAIQAISTDSTSLVYTETCAQELPGGLVMHNGDDTVVKSIPVKAVPAYNLVHKRDNGEFYHPKGMGNGYVLTFGDIKVYVAGDTENIPEMKKLNDIDIAFLPMNLPYTMTPEMVVDAVQMFHPKILYPYHYGQTDVSKLINLLKGDKQTAIRVRKMP
ncbi:MAG TPA: MBL fold metallo-hydrolase [Balneolales bacterium]|nr:MBL fold metallo-hydrolase [Balneolales bacterium]